MTSADMRRNLIAKYPGKAWKQKVDKMSDAQVYAVYVRMNNQTSNKRSIKK